MEYTISFVNKMVNNVSRSFYMDYIGPDIIDYKPHTIF